MKRIESFCVNHLDLFPGLYVSRRDRKDNTLVTTFDLRITAPNREPVLDTGSMHTIEHLGATFLRNSDCKNDIVYFGPMGCRTGFYLIMFNRSEASEVYETVLAMCDFIIAFEGEIPGAKANECGNYTDHNLSGAKEAIIRYKKELTDNRRFVYP